LRLTDDKISHLSHVVYGGLRERGLVSPTGAESAVRKAIKQTIVKTLKLEDEVDVKVQLKLQSYSRKIQEGSSEWNVLYDKFLTEELEKKGLAFD